jgi:hypothetical protein
MNPGIRNINVLRFVETLCSEEEHAEDSVPARAEIFEHSEKLFQNIEPNRFFGNERLLHGLRSITSTFGARILELRSLELVVKMKRRDDIERTHQRSHDDDQGHQ